jgi:hypothetical protein
MCAARASRVASGKGAYTVSRRDRRETNERRLLSIRLMTSPTIFQLDHAVSPFIRRDNAIACEQRARDKTRACVRHAAQLGAQLQRN